MTALDARAVFEILIREHHDMLAAFARSLVRDPSLADDVAQEAFIVAWRRLDDYDRERPFGPWLRGIASRIALAHHRRAARRAAVCFTTDEETLVHLEALYHRFSRLSGDSWDDRLDALRACLSQLADRDREVLAAHYRDGQTCEEIATAQAASLEAVKKRLQRSRARLADCIEGKLAAVAEASTAGTST